MGNYRPLTPAQWMVFDDVLHEMPLIDETFDETIDFSDPHQVELEVTNQSKSHSNH